MRDTETTLQAGIQLRAAVPTFLASDVASTARWYSDRLGFHTAGTVPKHEPYVYASLQRDGAEIMLPELSESATPYEMHAARTRAHDLQHWFGGLRPGMRAVSALNPLVYQRGRG